MRDLDRRLPARRGLAGTRKREGKPADATADHRHIPSQLTGT
jgi:hypothetical protein